MEFFPQKIERKLTLNIKNVLKKAENVSRELKHESIGIEHIIFSIISQRGSVGSNMLGIEKVDLKSLHKFIDDMPKAKIWKSQLSENLKNILKKSVLVASRYKHTYVGTEHLLYAILISEDRKMLEFFSLIGIDADKLKEQIRTLMESKSRFSDISELFNSPADPQRMIPPSPMGGGMIMEMPAANQALGVKQSALDYFCIDLMKEIEDEKADSVIGRKDEINKIINVLIRKTKNNPILIGEPGVGKTAVVQGLAQRIFQGDVPVSLLGKRIYSLDMGLLVAGTVFRGEFEARLKDIIGEAQDNPNAILFIDEIHTIIGAGNTSGSGSLDAANILKPPLSRGSISCIGATTLDEYRKHFKKDAALERRFQKVLVEEPCVVDTKEMLRGLKDDYEKHHNLNIGDEALDSAVDLSQRFINDRFLPDKALDVLDEASSLVRSRFGGKNYFKKIKILEAEKRTLQEKKEEAIEKEKYDDALAVKEKETILKKHIDNLYKIQEKESSAKIKIPVTSDDIAEVITQMTGIPVSKLVSGEKKRLKNLEKQISKHIVGQDEPIEIIAKSIRRSRAGISDANMPIGVFMFLGPTGVGKTELAKVLASVIYKNPKSLIKVDMSEFMEKHNVSRLVGAPAGYVGYEEGGKLTEQVRLHPYSIVLFDEIEKAHPDVFNLMLQIFEDGELTDATGRKVDFRNTIIIMTSNIGTSELTEEAKWGFYEEKKMGENEKKNEIRDKYIETKEMVLKELKEELRPEFMNRISKILIFNPLSAEDIKDIVKIQFEGFQKRLLASNNVKINIDKKALDYISEKSFNPNEGARLVRRNLQEMVEDLVSEKIIDGKIKSGSKIKISADKNGIVFVG